MTPCILVTIINTLQLSFSPDFALAQFTGCPYPPLILLMSSLYWYFICVWTCDAVFRGCVQIIVSHIFPQWAIVWWGMIPSTLWASCNYPIIRISDDPSWTGRGTSRSLSWVLSAGSCLQYQFGAWFLCPTVSYADSQPLPLGNRCGSSCLNDFQRSCWENGSYFFCEQLAVGSKNGCTMGGVPTKGRSGEGYDGGGVSVRQVGLWEGPRAGGSSSSGAGVVACVSPPCCTVDANASSM